MKNNLKSKNQKSNFFNFDNNQINNSCKLAVFKGWNKSLLIKISFSGSGIIDNNFIKSNFPSIVNKEKLFIITSGKSKFKSKNKLFNLKKFDAISIFSDNQSYSFECKKNNQIFIVSSERFKKRKNKSIYFNFKESIKPIDIWGGQCISSPYSGIDLNIVMFDLKKDFRFDDQGHKNEQITWVISGSMNFYSNKSKKKLTNQNGIDIGSSHKHGGVSNGAIGFDAFFPKRNEKQYKHKVKMIKF